MSAAWSAVRAAKWAAVRRSAPSAGLAAVLAAVLLAVAGLCAGAAARAAAPLPAPAQAPAPAAYGLHGMLLFGGREGLFASHLPMFHAPHDRQVVLRIRLEDAALQRRLGERLAREPGLWTLVPERFDLHRLAPGADAPLRGFRADIVEGHFERGGRTVHRDVAVRVVAVPVYRALDPAARRAPTLAYLRIGAGPRAREQFLVLRIDARPGADHVLALRRGRRPLPPVLSVAADADDGLGAREDSLAQALSAHGARLRAAVYRETGDLR